LISRQFYNKDDIEDVIRRTKDGVRKTANSWYVLSANLTKSFLRTIIINRLNERNEHYGTIYVASGEELNDAPISTISSPDIPGPSQLELGTSGGRLFVHRPRKSHRKLDVKPCSEFGHQMAES
jgi:hypothetical protein